MAAIDEKDVLDGEALNDLYHWIDAVPLSRAKKNIARDFSDGVSVAEIIHHYLPRAVDLHNYVVVSSTGQKRINWNTLNRKVFGKMNIKLSELTLNQVVDAKPGAIEQVLWDLRRKIMENATTSSITVDHTHEITSTKSTPGNARSLHAVNTIVAPKGSSLIMRSSHVQIGSRPSAMWTKSSTNTAPRQVKPTFGAMISPKVQPKTIISEVQRQPSSFRPLLPLSPISKSALEKSVPEETVKENESLPATASQKMSFCELGEVPSQIVFRGHKMVMVEMLENKDKEMKDLENSKKQLNIKIDRLQKIVLIKDTRIEELSHQLLNLRTMYENATSHVATAGLTVVKTEDINNNDIQN